MTLLDHRFASDAPPDLVASIHSVIQSRAQPFRFRGEDAGVWPLLMLLLFVLQMPVHHGLTSLGLPGWAATVLLFALIIGVGWFWRGSIRQRLAASIRATCLARGHCACCGYSLWGLDARDDGCAICPECSAAWRLPAELNPAPENMHPASPSSLRPLGLLGRWFGHQAQSILDARGRIVRLIDPDVRKHPPPGWPQLSRSLRERIDIGIFGLAFGNRLFMLLVGVLMVWAGVRQLTSSSSLTPAAFLDFAMSLFLLTIGLIGFGYALSRRIISNPQSLADLMLQHNACPSCATELNTDAPDPRTCANCGAVWNRPARN